MNIFSLIGSLIHRHPGPVPPVPPGPVPTPTPQPTPDPATTPQFALLAAVNAARTADGRAPLAANAKLDGIAQAWAARDANSGQLTHGDFAGRLRAAFPDAAGGEDIGEGYASGAAVVQAWANDPAHRVILLGDWDSVGCGWASGTGGQKYWVADFARLHG